MKYLLHWSDTASELLHNLQSIGRGRKQALSVVIDAITVMVALWLSMSLRLGEVFQNFDSTWYLFLLHPLFTVAVFAQFGIYRWVVRSTNERLIRQLVKASLVSSVLVIIFVYLFPPVTVTPRSLFAIYWILLSFGTCTTRFVWKELFDTGRRGKPVAVYGAGDAGQQLVRVLASNPDYYPRFFLDDNPDLIRSTISGLPVMSAADPDLIQHLKQYDVLEVILAMPVIGALDYQQKLSRFENTGINVRTIPTISELISGDSTAGEVRDISINDILGRSEILPDTDMMSFRVAGKVVLVTGAGGSIGSELCRQIMHLNPVKLIMLDNGEANLYQISEDIQAIADKMASRAPQHQIVLLSVCNARRIDRLLGAESVDTIFHAAAYKHVPIVEAFPSQGIEVNIFGTQTVLQAAIKHKVSHFTLISTDKAVRPSNAMGASKRLAEMLLQVKALERHSTNISMVRFGNVLGSSGSVVHKFKKQIESGGPITLTDRKITRFFMTIPEAVQLVLQSSSIASGGDVFVLDMGQPVEILSLARTMTHLMGRKLREDTGSADDIEILVKGLRPGEKMFEELFIGSEISPTIIPKVFVAQENHLSARQLEKCLKELMRLSNEDNDSLTARYLMSLVVGNAAVPSKSASIA